MLQCVVRCQSWLALQLVFYLLVVACRGQRDEISPIYCRQGFRGQCKHGGPAKEFLQAVCPRCVQIAKEQILAATAREVSKEAFAKAAAVFIKAGLIVRPSNSLDRQARRFGLCGLGNLADNSENREAMWKDDAAMKALLNGCSLAQSNAEDEEGVECAVDALLSLAKAPGNRKSMWRNIPTRHCIVKRAKSYNLNARSQSIAFQTLAELSLNKTVAEGIWRDRFGARAALVTGALSDSTGTNDTDVLEARAQAFRALSNIGLVERLRRSMWKDSSIRSALMASIKLSEPSQQPIRVFALSLLANLAMNADNAQDIWTGSDPGTRTPFNWYFWIQLAATPVGQSVLQDCQDIAIGQASSVPGATAVIDATVQELAAVIAGSETFLHYINVTEQGMTVLVSLATIRTIRSDIWNDATGLTSCLFTEWGFLAEPEAWYQVDKMFGLESLVNIAAENDLRESIWNDHGSSIVTVAGQEEADSIPTWQKWFAFVLLWELAGNPAVKALIWDDATASSTLTMASDLFTEAEGMIRDVALGVLSRLATDQAIAPAMFQDADFLNNIVQVADKLTDMRHVLSRTFAYSIIYEWSRPDLLLGEDMWLDESLRQVVVEGTYLKEPWQAELQAFALASLRNWASSQGDDYDLRKSIWEDADRARAALLTRANDTDGDQKTARGMAMCTMESLSTEVTVQEQMWNEDGVRDILNTAAVEGGNSIAQECALATLFWLANNTGNAQYMWASNSTKEVLLVVSGNLWPHQRRAREIAVRIMSMLARSDFNKNPMWFGREAGYSFIRNSNKAFFFASDPVARETRAWALQGLETLATDQEVAKFMFRDKFGAMRVIYWAALSTSRNDIEARTFAFAALARLAETPDNRIAMWFDFPLRAIMVNGAKHTVDWRSTSRAAAIASFWQLSFDPQLRRAMWHFTPVRVVILLAAQNDPPDQKAYLLALHTMINWARDQWNQEKMWQDPGNQDVVCNAVGETGRVQAAGLALLALQSMNRRNQVSIWGSDCGVIPDLVDAAQTSTASPDSAEIRSRQYALAALSYLARHPSNRHDMFLGIGHGTAVQSALHHACADEGDSDPGPVGRAYALSALMYLSMSSTVAETLVRSPSLMECVVARSIVPSDRVAGSVEVGGTVVVPIFFSLLSNFGAQVSASTATAQNWFALMTLSYLCLESGAQAEIWNELTPATTPSVRSNLVAAATITHSDHTWSNLLQLAGLLGLGNLAQKADIKLDMWQNITVRRAFADAGELNSDDDRTAEVRQQWTHEILLSAIRDAGLLGLYELSKESAVRKPMWDDSARSRKALLNGLTLEIRNDFDAEARANACNLITQLAMEEQNQVGIWDDDSVRRAIMQVAQDDQPSAQKSRAACMAGLKELSRAQENQEAMWAGTGPTAYSRRLSSSSRQLFKLVDTLSAGFDQELEIGVAATSH